MVPTSILRLIENISRYSDNDMSKVLVIPKTNPSATNRANSVGDALEFFIRDSFCDSYTITDGVKKSKIYSSNFSYLGNQNNPPDIIIKNSDAFEIKKIENPKSSLALNSSPPKDKLLSSYIRITNACRNCEANKWAEKDLFYVIGHAIRGKIKYLFFIHGICYAAEYRTYDKKKESIKINQKENSFVFKPKYGKTKNPFVYFKDYVSYDRRNKFSLFVIMTKEKFDSMPKVDIEKLKTINKVMIKDIMIKNPNNLEKLMEAKLVRYEI